MRRLSRGSTAASVVLVATVFLGRKQEAESWVAPGATAPRGLVHRPQSPLADDHRRRSASSLASTSRPTPEVPGPIGTGPEDIPPGPPKTKNNGPEATEAAAADEEALPFVIDPSEDFETLADRIASKAAEVQSGAGAETTTAAAASTTMPEAPPSGAVASTGDDLADVRERIRRRAAELNLRASDGTPDDLDDSKPVGWMEQMALDSLSEAELERLSDDYGDGLNVVEGAWKELALIEWPTAKEVFETFVESFLLTVFMVGYVFLVDYALHHLFDPIFHYPAMRPENAALAAKTF